MNKKFVNNQSGMEYSLMEGCRDWLRQSDINPSDKNISRLCDLNGGVIPYPYQKEDRKRIRKNEKKRYGNKKRARKKLWKC